MSAYLKIAEEVLRVERRPLSARTILNRAFLAGLVPDHLHGETQHKTLQARLSEDVLYHRERSRFYRTAPGVFFLSEFLGDESIDNRYKNPITAKRRKRELRHDAYLSVNSDSLERLFSSKKYVSTDYAIEFLQNANASFERSRHTDKRSKVWCAALVRRCDQVLSYRIGKYREDRDGFLLRKSIAFSAPVSDDDQTFWNYSEFGIVDAGIRAALLDLDLQPSDTIESREVRPKYFFSSRARDGSLSLVAVVDFECPSWFEPTTRRLSLLDIRWMDIGRPGNNLDDFDPWSRSILDHEIDHLPGLLSYDNGR